MSLAVVTVLCPPSLDDLDSWGDLDSLRWSLDSAVWEQCGIYELHGGEAAQSSDFCNGGLNVNDTLEGEASSLGLCVPQVLRIAAAAAEAESAGYCDGGRQCNAALAGSAESAAVLDGSCIWQAAFTAAGQAGGALFPQRDVSGICTASALSGESLLWELPGYGWEAGAAAASAWTAQAGREDAWQPVPAAQHGWQPEEEAQDIWTLEEA